jgi:uncharacterized membrane protein YjjB (DUF3815 family)
MLTMVASSLKAGIIILSVAIGIFLTQGLNLE